jgi:hypothetical protein
VAHNQSANLGKLDREGLLELCKMMMGAGANVDQDRRANDAARYVDDAIALLADEKGEVTFEEFEDWWSKNRQHQSHGIAMQEHSSNSRTATDGAEGLDSMEDRFAAAQAAIIASLNASDDHVPNEDAIAAAIAAADEAVGTSGSPSTFPDATTVPTSTGRQTLAPSSLTSRCLSSLAGLVGLGSGAEDDAEQRRKDAAMVAELLRQEGASEEAIAAVSRAAPSNHPGSRGDKYGMMMLYLQAGAAGVVAAAVAWAAQASMMSG